MVELQITIEMLLDLTEYMQQVEDMVAVMVVELLEEVVVEVEVAIIKVLQVEQVEPHRERMEVVKIIVVDTLTVPGLVVEVEPEVDLIYDFVL